MIYGLTLVSVLACSDEKPPESAQNRLDAFDAGLERSEVDSSRVLATVNGNPIYKEDIAHYLESGMTMETPQKALDMVIRDTLLADEARRRGYAKAPLVVSEFKKALALQQLVQKGNAFTTKSISKSKIKETYEKNRGRYVHDRLRTVVHALVEKKGEDTSSGELRKMAQKIYEETKDSVTESEFRNGVDRVKAMYPHRKIVVEKLPPFDAQSERFVRSFVAGTFAVAYPNTRVSSIVETRFGMHVIFIDKEEAESNVSFEEAAPRIAEELLPEEKRQHVANYIENVYQRGNVFVYDEILAETGKGTGRQ